MQLKILFFATLKDLAGTKRTEIYLEKSNPTLADVRQSLIQSYPHMTENLQSSLAAVNEDYAFDEQIICDGDQIAFFPPVSGGDGDNDHLTLPEIYRLPYEPIDHDELVHAITTPATGAVVFFSGFVRGETRKEGHLPKTTHLEYEAYESMAFAKMKQVAAEIRENFPDVIGIAIVQRLGKLQVGDNTVLIACSSAHRDSGCFEAAQYGINRLKEIVPVWKKEIGIDGQAWVEGDYHPTPDDKS